MAKGKESNDNLPEVRATYALPTFLKGETDLGVDQIAPEDIKIPWVRICQGQSQIKQEADVRDGHFYNSTAKADIGETFSFFPLTMRKGRVWFSKELKYIGEVYFEDSVERWNGEIEYCKAHREEGKDVYDYLVIPEQDLAEAIVNNTIPFPVRFSCMSAAVSMARDLNSKIKTNASRRIPIYGQLVITKTKLKVFPEGSAYMPLFQFDRLLSEAEFPVLKELFNLSKTLKGKIKNDESPF